MSLHSRAMFKAAIILSQRYNITIGEQFIGWYSVETGGDVTNALRNTCLLISDSNIVGIVGPGLSSESHFLAPFAAKIGIPIISYASTDPKLYDRNAYPAFYRTVPSDNIAALAIAKLFIQYNWTSCIIIYQNDAFGLGAAKAISDEFDNNNLKVTNTIIFDIVTLSIRGNLKSLLTSSTARIVILWAIPNYASLILQNALDLDVVGPKFTWILSANISVNIFNQTYYQKLRGMLTITPVVGNIVTAPINKTLLNAAYQIWQEYELESFPGSDNVDYYALFAFDATWTLIQSLKQLCSINIKNSSSCISFINASYCFDRRFLNSHSFFNIINNNIFLGVSGSIQFSINVTDRIKGIYYVAKNLQYSSNTLNYVPVLVWSDSNEWRSYTQSSVIIWPGISLVPPSGYASVLGVTLRIAVTEIAPFTIVTQASNRFGKTKIKLVGYIPDLIELLKNRMGFIPKITLVTNQTFNEVIKAVENDTYDMFIAQTTITSTRREKVAFSNSIFDNSLRIIIRKESKPGVDFLSYLRPFSFKLWMTLSAASICAGFLICLLEHQENEALRDLSIISIIAMSIWYAFGAIVGYGVDFHVKTAAGRLLTLALYILSLISVAAYTANLASDLTLSKSDNIISGIEDIKNGKIAFSRIGILVGTSFEEYYLREISRGVRDFYPVKSNEEIYNYLLNNIIDASIMDGSVLEYITGNVYCNLTLVGSSIDQSASGIVFQKKWQYEQDFDINILALRESGALDDLTSKWFQSTYCSQPSKSSTALTVESMAGLYLTFATISILAVFLFVWKKRFIMKNYLLTLIRRKNLSITQDVYTAKDSIEISL